MRPMFANTMIQSSINSPEPKFKPLVETAPKVEKLYTRVRSVLSKLKKKTLLEPTFQPKLNNSQARFKQTIRSHINFDALVINKTKIKINLMSKRYVTPPHY